MIGPAPGLIDPPQTLADVPTNPLKAIRRKCIDCSAGCAGEVERCELTHCPLWPFRLGRNPHRTPATARKLGFEPVVRPVSEAQRLARERAGERLRAMQRT